MLGIIGTGNMGRALIKAMDIKVRYGHNDNNTAENEVDVMKKSSIIILAVKPKDYESLLFKIKASIQDKIIIMIAAGYSIEKAEKILGEDKKIVRMMPNTPVMIGEGISAINFNKNIEEKDREIILTELSKTGKVVEIPEIQFDVFTAVAGSLPAYVYMMIEALSDAAVLHGMNRAASYEIISQAISGSAQMVPKTSQHPAKLKDDVCSPAGTTIEAVRQLDAHGFRNALINAVDACVKKSKSM